MEFVFRKANNEDLEMLGKPLLEHEHDSVFMAGVSDGHVQAILSADLDRVQGLCKVRSYEVRPEFSSSRAFFSGILQALEEHLQEHEHEIECLYLTTRATDLQHQAWAVDLEYKVVGLFPGAISREPSRMNTIVAKYFNGKDLTDRMAFQRIHPGVRKVFDLVRREFGLSDREEQNPGESFTGNACPTLELILAERLVESKFEALKARRFLSSGFYPFQTPNAMLTNADQTLQIFLRLIPESRFGVIIGEHLQMAVDVPRVLGQALQILSEAGIDYVELVNDAGDVEGVDQILRAGFEAGGYFPGLKRHGGNRRDYLIFFKCRNQEASIPEGLPDRVAKFLSLYPELWNIPTKADRP